MNTEKWRIYGAFPVICLPWDDFAKILGMLDIEQLREFAREMGMPEKFILKQSKESLIEQFYIENED